MLAWAIDVPIGSVALARGGAIARRGRRAAIRGPGVLGRFGPARRPPSSGSIPVQDEGVHERGLVVDPDGDAIRNRGRATGPARGDQARRLAIDLFDVVVVVAQLLEEFLEGKTLAEVVS